MFRPRAGLWRPPFRVLAGLALAAVLVAVAFGTTRPGFRVPPSVREEAGRAEQLMARAERVVYEAKQAAGVETEGGARSSLIGAELTPLTTTLGNLEAKRLSNNPAWARVLAIRLHEAGLRAGDVVAAGLSGSFPGLDLALVAACQSLQLKLVAVSSVTASSWGANQPGFTWPEIEARLVEAGVVARSSIAISAGGAGDRALDLEPGGRAQAERIAAAVAAKLGVARLAPADFDDSIRQRLGLYARAAAGRPIRLYANVGGTEASLGRSATVLRLRNGFLPGVPFDFSPNRGVMARFAERGIPVLTLLNIRDLALRWGLL